jgi:FkbM family methyltransferase
MLPILLWDAAPEVIRDWGRRYATVAGPDIESARTTEALSERIIAGDKVRALYRPNVGEVYTFRTPAGEVLYGLDDVLNQAFFSTLMPDGTVHEPGVVAYLCHALKPNDIFVDVGAHTGYVSCIAGVAGATVFAIEFQKPLAEVIERNLALNGLRRAHVLDLAAGDRDGMTTTPLYNPQLGTKLYRELAVQDREPPSLRDRNAQAVPIMRLDTLFADGEPPRLIKIDAEGHELRILAGASRLIAAGQTEFLVEYHTHIVGDFGSGIDSLETLFPTDRWRVFELRDKGMKELDAEGLRRLVNAPMVGKSESNHHIVFRPR